MERIYLDYNATAPLSQSFAQALANGEIPFANPASQHTSGKHSHKIIEEVKSYLFDYFGLSRADYEILFHSGATEASNLFLNPENCEELYYFVSDHPCVTNLKHSNSHELSISKKGKLENIKAPNKEAWLHYTYVHNETGIVWPLAEALKLKEKSGCKVYVDAVQAVGKISEQKLLPGIDVYTFSGHKFGALKGIGFSFYNKDLKLNPQIMGGGQQSGLRSGTLNVHGINSLKYALEDIQYSEALMQFKNEIINLLVTKSNISVVAGHSNNTICFMHKEMKADILLIHFDMAGLDVSTGSACSSGSLKESPTLKAMGYGELAKNNIRISLGNAHLNQKDDIIARMKLVLEKL